MASRSHTEVRFKFGQNWQRFLSSVDDQRVLAAEEALTTVLGNIRGKTFLDAGCGSGLSSLAAHRLGAHVAAFDYDTQSVACTKELQRCHGLSWRTEEGSVLDANYLTKLGQYDIVCSWGVLHHTGKMYEAFRNIAMPVKPGGLLFISIYNDQGFLSFYWKSVKRIYNTGWFGRAFMTLIHLPYVGGRFVVRKITRRPIERGMSLWVDYIDWLGGYPFEVAKPRDVIEFFAGLGFTVVKTNLVGGSLVGRRSGNNEFVFRKNHDQPERHR